MSVYSYTTDSIEIFEDPILYGFLVEVPAETIDAGNISASVSNVEINGYIVNTETIYPFGSAKVSGNSNSCFVRSTTAEKQSVKLSGTITEGIQFTWVGSGTLFEIGGSQERIIAPWVGSSGPLRFVGLSINKTAYNYKEFISASLTADDYGLISSAVSSYQDFGSISAIEFNAGSENYGSIAFTNTETSFSTSFGIKGSANQAFKPSFKKVGTGIVTVSGESSSEFIPSYDGFGLFNIVGGDRYSTSSSNASNIKIFAVGSKEESFIFDYDVNSTEFYSEEDYEFITSFGSTESYGLISSLLDSGIDSRGYIVNLITENPFGSFALSGTLSSNLSNSFFGSGKVSIAGNANNIFEEPVPQIYKYTETSLFKVSGASATALQSEFTYLGSGYSLNFGGSTLAITWRYTIDSSVEFVVDNYGLITQSGTAINYGLVSLVLDEGIDSFGHISNLTANNPFGTLSLTGNFVPKLTNSFIGSGNKVIYGNASTALVEPAQQTYRYTDLTLFNILGAASTRFERESRYLGIGSLFNIGSSTSARTWNYTIDSEVEFVIDNYGLITSSGTVLDYGLVSLPPLDSPTESYGYITNLTTERPFGFVAIFNGSAIQKYKPQYNYIGKGSVDVFGESPTRFIPSYDSFGLFNVTGGDNYSISITNKSAGVIFTIGSKQETVTFDYNIRSSVIYSEEDYEFIISSGTTENYGSIASPLDSGIDSYGYITSLTTEYAFGQIAKISGSVENKYKPLFAQDGQAFINVHGESKAQYIPSYDSFGLFDIIGGDKYSTSISNISIGSIFTIGSKQESKVFDYNISSIELYVEEDSGLITSVGSAENYGLITTPLDSGIDSYGYITNLTTEYSFGSVGSISGSVDDKYAPLFAHFGKLLVNVRGESSTQFIPSYDSFGLFNVTGGERYASVISNVSSGVILTIGFKQETATFDYNESSILTYSEEDYQLISSVASSTENYGSIALPLDSGIDSYGYIVTEITDYPFGSIGSIGGHGIEEYEPIFAQTGQGSIDISGESLTKFVPTYNSFGLFDIVGNGKYSTTARNAFNVVKLFTDGLSEESTSFHYNLSSIELHFKEDFGSIASSGTTEDYGSLSLEFHSIADQYGYITNITTSYPFGSIASITGHAEEMYDPIYMQIGEAFINISGQSSSQFVPSYDSFGLFNVTGGDKYTVAFSNDSLITLFAVGSKQEIVTFDYNTSSVEIYNDEDFGFITLSGTTKDFGLITVPFDSGLDSYGYLANLTTVYPFGPVATINGSSIGRYVPSFSHNAKLRIDIHGESASQFIPSYDSFGLFAVTGGDKYTVSFSNDTTITVFANGSKQESAVFDYNISSVEIYDPQDYGFITLSGTTEDFGSITVPFDSGIDSYGYLANLTTVYPFGPIASISGHADEMYDPNFIQIGSGFINISGHSPVQFVPSYDSTGLFNISGGERYSTVFANVSTFRLFTIGSKQESAVFDYNESSIEIYNSEDFGSITSSGTIEDYGSLSSEFHSIADSYGYITNLFTAYPFGSIASISGHADEMFDPYFSQIGQVLITISGESSSQFKPSYVSFGLFNITGGERYTTSIVNVTSGFLISFGSKEESAVFDYNINSTEIYSEEDYEFIISSGSTEDFGLITSPLDSGIDSYGYITNLTTVYAFGSVASISGSVGESFAESPYIASGSLFAVNGVAESTRINPKESTALFVFSGTSGEILITQAFAGKGSLFTIGSKKEYAVFSYNTSSVVTYSEEDFEFITSFGSSEDYGSIELPLDSGIDSYGYIVTGITEYPFGSIASISGHADEMFDPAFMQIGRGFINISGESSNKFVPTYLSFGLFDITGGEQYSSTFNNVSEDIITLFTIGSKQESKTFNYTLSSIEPYSHEDFGSIASSGTTEDYGSLSLEFHSIAEYYGYITNITTEYPFGSIASIGGHADEMFDPSFSQVGQALINVSGHSEVKFVPSYDSIGLFSITGGERSTLAFSNESTFTLFTIGSKEEIVTFDYNTSSIVTYSDEDYGFITSSGTTEDYGSVALPLDSGIDSYGYITNLTAVYPFGPVASISGSLVESLARGSFNASGSLFALNGVAESRRINPQESIALFAFSGFSAEKNTESYVGKGTAFGFGGLSETVTRSENITTLFRISGSVKQSFTESPYIASGSLFALNGVAESRRINPQESAALFTFSGSSIEKNTESYVGRGTVFGFNGLSETVTRSQNITTLFRISGSAKQSFAGARYNASGSLFAVNGAAESATSNPPENKVLFKFNGFSTEKNTESYVGRGTVFGFSGPSAFEFAGTSVAITISENVSIFYTISGSAEESFTEGLYTASGSLFAVDGAAESTTSNPPESTTLFVLSGANGDILFTQSYVGRGSLFTIGSKQESAVFDYNTSSIAIYGDEDYGFITSSGTTEDYGSVALPLDSGIDSYGYITNLTAEYPFGFVARFNGAAKQSFAGGLYTGSGSLFALNGVAESTRSNPPENTALFVFSGFSTEKNTESYVGKGTAFGFGGLSETVTKSENITTLLVISGSAKPLFAKNIVATSGSLFAVNGVAESTRSNPPENTALFTFSGFSTEKNTESYIGSGSLFTIGSKKEYAVFSYNTSSVVTYSAEDYGFITSSGTTEDYGSIALPLDSGIDSYGYIVNDITEYPFGSVGSISGHAEEIFNASFAVVGFAQINISGESANRSLPSLEYKAFGLFDINGQEKSTRSISIQSSGTLFTIGSKQESAVFSYNTSSVAIYSEEDYEFITSNASSTENYGSVALPLDSGIDSYGYITNLTTVYPFGPLVSISGSGSIVSRGSYNATGSLFALNGVAESRRINPQESTALFTFSGASGEILITQSFAGNGSLFSIGNKIESAAYDYNQSSIKFSDSDDYGLISNIPNSYIDNGNINEFATEGEYDYGYITQSQTDYPLNILFNISGSASTPFTFSQISEFGSLFAVNGAAESVGVNPSESTALFSVSGKSRESFSRASYEATGLLTYSGFMTGMKLTVVNPVGGSAFISGFIEESFSEGVYTGSGSLFTFEGAVESVGANPPESTALFSVSGKSLESFGRASHFAAGGLTYSGFMTGMKLTVVNPVGGTAFVSGFIEESFSEGLYTGSGSLFTFEGASESVGANPPESTALFNVSGKSLESFARASHFAAGGLTYSGFMTGMKLTVSNPVGGAAFISGFIEESFSEGLYTGSGSLFGYSGAAESKTVDIPEFFGLFEISGSAKESFTESNYNGSGSAYVDGFASGIKFSPTNVGSGFVYVSGAFSDLKLSYNNFGSGSLFGYSGAAESKTVDIPEFFGLFEISGSKIEAYAKAPYLGSVSFEFGGKLLSEKQTESYIGSGDSTLSGVSKNRFVPNWNAFGSLFTYSDGSQIEKQTDVYVGFGSLFSINGAVESVAVNPQERFGLLNIFGSAIEKNTESYVGSGDTTVSGEVTAIFNPNLIGSGSVFVSGEVSDTKLSYNNIGFGSLFAISGAAESFTTITPTATALFSIFGVATESNTENYVGIGSVSFGSSAKELFTPNNVGFGSLFSIGGASESYGVAERFTGLFEISGSKFESYSRATHVAFAQITTFGFATEKNTENYVGYVNASFDGFASERFIPHITGSGSALVSGNAAEKQTDIYIGSGNLFEFSGVQESTTVNPEENVVLFRFSGTLIERNTESYVGSGDSTLSGVSDNRFVPNWNAFGSLFGYSGAAESKTVNIPPFFGLFNISGSKFEAYAKATYIGFTSFEFGGNLLSEKQTDSYVGSGEASLSGVSKNRFVPNWNAFGSINVTGLVEESNTEVYIGYITQEISGFAKEVSKIASYKGYSEINISGYITERQTDAYAASGTLFGISGSQSSASFNPPETTSLFVFEGSSTSTRARKYTGFGSIFEFNGAAESSTKAEETSGLFEINGSSTAVFARKYYASGTLFAISGTSESIAYDLPKFTGLYTVSGYALSSVTSNPPENTAQYTISGAVRDIKLSYGKKGFGSLFSINGASVISAPAYTSEKIDGIKILGKARESYARSSYVSSGTQFIAGISENEYRFFEPSFTYVTII